MKTKITLLPLLLFISIIASCTPNPMVTDNQEQKAPTIYGTGGEQSAEPDNEKD